MLANIWHQLIRKGGTYTTALKCLTFSCQNDVKHLVCTFKVHCVEVKEEWGVYEISFINNEEYMRYLYQ
jgi:hypothetical protein